MNIKEAEKLFDKYVSGACTETEKLQFERIYAQISDLELHDIPAEKLEEIRKIIYARLPKPVIEYADESTAAPKQVKLWPQPGLSTIWKIAAAVAAITLGVWLYNASNTPRHSGEGRNPGSAQYATDIAPGRNTATLTLANGEMISLSDAKKGVVIDASKLTYNDGEELGISSESVEPLKEGSEVSSETPQFPASRNAGSLAGSRMLAVSTPRGGQYQVVLPDGTKVWLNADSKISFPSQFIGGERKVLLVSGEAYFEVVHNAKQPFRVESKGQVVEDIGTAFNIQAYSEEGSIKTTLVEGSASVSSLRGGTHETSLGQAVRQTHLLKPNQQAILTNGSIKVQEVDTETIIDWKNGDFVFKGEDFKTAMRKISRWYNVEIIYDPDVQTNIEPGGWISRKSNLSAVLELIESAGHVHFKMEGRRIRVTK